MASLIQIKRSTGSSVPQLRPGEMAYSAGETDGQGKGVLYIGSPTTTQGGYSQTAYVIGGKKYTELLDTTAGQMLAGKAVVADAQGKIETVKAKNVVGVLDSDSGSTTLTIGGAQTLNQKVIIHDPYVKNEQGQIVALSQFVKDLADAGLITITAGTGIAPIENQQGTYTISLADTGVAAKQYGSASKIPVITVNAQGQITAAEEQAVTIPTVLNLGDGADGSGSVDLASGKLEIAQGGGVTVALSDGKFTLGTDSTIVKTTGAQSVAGVKTFTEMPLVTGAQGDVKSGEANEVAKLGTIKAQTVYTDVSENGATVAIGGIPKGKKYENTDVLTIINELLHPYVAPTGVSLTLNEGGGTFEMGVTKTINSGTVRWTNGSTRIKQAEILVGGQQKGTADVVGVVTSQAVSLTEPMEVKSNTSFTARVTEESESKQVSGGNVSFTFVYPFYHGVLEAGVLVDETAVKGLTKDVSVKGTKSYTYDTAGASKKVVIAYPKSYGNLRSALDPNNFENIDKFNGGKSEVSITGLDGTPQNYFVYAIDTNVSNFTFKFSF